MADLQLVSFDLCPFVQRSVIALKEKGVDFEIAYIDLKDPPDWFRKISPLGKVPVLRVGEEVLFESAVINEYLDETCPPPLHPRDPLTRAKHRAWIEVASELNIQQYKLLLAKDDEAYHRRRDEARRTLERLEMAVDGPLFAGENLSLVDTAFAPALMRFEIMDRYHDTGLSEDLPNLRVWSQALLERPSVQESVVADFEQRFRRHFAEQGSLFGGYLA